LIEYLKTWKFRPGSKHEDSVAFGCAFDFVWSTGLPTGYVPPTLAEAALQGPIDASVILLADGPNPDEHRPGEDSALSSAALKANSTLVRLLLDSGANPSLKSSKGNYPLHDAAVSGNPDIVRALLAAGAAVGAVTDVSQQTALHLAAGWGRLEVVRLLLDFGASPSARNAKSRTPVEEAMENEQTSVVLLLQNVRN
jgi:ankyrin repeat protein